MNTMTSTRVMIGHLLTLTLLLVAGQASGQTTLTADEWRADLQFLQSIVHDEYAFLFKKTTAEAFDAAVEDLHRKIPALEPHEIIAGLARLVSSFEYGHTTLRLRGNEWVDRRIPVNLYRFSDGIYIEGVHADYESALGARVVKIEGMPIDAALDAIRPLVPAENDQFFTAYGLDYLTWPELLHAQRVTPDLRDAITLTLERDGATFDLTIPAGPSDRSAMQYGYTWPVGRWLSARNQDRTPLYLKHLHRLYFFEHLPEHNAVYVRHSQIQDDPTESIPSFYDRLFEFIEANEVERLIIDVRLNGGGNNYKNKPIVNGIVRCTRIDQPGKLFVITGRRTFSACQNLVNELDNYTNALFVGEPTAENVNFYGDNRSIMLPNSGLTAYLSFAWWQDKPQWENAPWTAPHLAVDVTFDDYRSNRDGALDTALAFSDESFIRDPLAYLEELFEEGQYAEAAAEAKRIVADPTYRFFDFEREANRIGYELLSDRRYDAAIWVFELNTSLYPDSANTWDSLAEAYLKSGDADKAVEFYAKASELDPDGATGRNARSMLEQIGR